MNRAAFAGMLALFLEASYSHAQANCTRTLNGAVYDDSAYSEESMSYAWSGEKVPKWFNKTIGKWNKCDVPTMQAGTGGASEWTVRYSTTVPPGYGPPEACGATNFKKREPVLFTTAKGHRKKPNCPDHQVTLLHELGHSLGLDHDGPQCPVTVMKAEPMMRTFGAWLPT